MRTKFNIGDKVKVIDKLFKRKPTFVIEKITIQPNKIIYYMGYPYRSRTSWEINQENLKKVII